MAHEHLLRTTTTMTAARSATCPIERQTKPPVIRIAVVVLLTLLASACGTTLAVGGDDATPPIGERPEFVADMAVAPEIDLGGDLGFTPMSETAVTANPDGTTTIIGTVDVPTAGGPVAIDDAEVIVETDPTTGESKIVGGVGRVPFPRLGELGDAVINHLPEGIIGVAHGRDLRHLGAHLVDDREYLYFHFDGGLDVGLPFAGRPGFEALPASISVPTGKSATFVLDPTDPYFYIGGACPQSNSDDDNDSTPNDNGMNRDRTGDPTPGDSPDESADETLYTIEAADLPPGEECGFGFSLNGNIPAPATAGGSTFNGHVVLDGVVPLYAGIELDGSTLVSFANGVRTVGWGNVVTSIPLVPALLDIRIPLGAASVELQSEGQRIGIAIEGQLAVSEEIVLPLDIPIALPNSGGISFTAALGVVPDAEGRAVYDQTSHARITGTSRLGLDHYGQLIGLDLSDMATTETTIRIDESGARLTGMGNLSIHPSLATDAITTIDAFISATDPAASFLAGNSNVRVLGTDIAAAAVRLDRSGLFVDGTVTTGSLDVQVAGRITDATADLTGQAVVSIAVDGLADAAQRTSERINAAIAEVERLDEQIEAARAAVRAEIRERDQGFVAARSALSAAERHLDATNDRIRSNNDEIDRLQDQRRDEVKRFESLGALQKGLQGPAHLITLADLEAGIVSAQVDNNVQRGYKATAELAVAGAREALDIVEQGLDRIPVDADPRIASLIATREVAVTTLESLRAGADAIAIGGSVQGTIQASVGAGGLGGSFAGEFCPSNGTGCVPVAGGRVEYHPSPQLCIDLLGLGERCLAF